MSVDIEEAVNPLAPTPGRDATTIDVGPGLLYIAPLGTAEPPDPTDASWPAAWIELGYTDDGSEFKVEPTVDDINVAEEKEPVKTIVSTVKSTLAVSMAQITAFNFQVAMGGGTIVTATGYVTFQPPVAGTEKEVMLGWRALDLTESMIWRRCKSDGALDIARKGGNNKALLPVTFTILVPAGGLRPWKWTAIAAKKGPDGTPIFGP